jgi:alanine-synthesizing transaminase
MFVWAKYPAPFAGTLSSLDFSMKLLEEANVAVSPGSGFGAAGEAGAYGLAMSQFPG